LYVIASEQDYQRLRQQFKLYNIATLIVGPLAAGVAAVYFNKQIDAFVFVVIVVLLGRMFYSAWMRHLLPRLKVSDERLSHREF
jgi:hypothetical protein